MILPLTNAGDAWDEVVQGAGGGPVLVFVASPDPDALAAARTITALLRADLVRYELHPVTGYAHLRDTFRGLVHGDAAVEPRAVLCVNCGAGVDLAHVLGLGEASRGDADGDDGEDGEREGGMDKALKVFVLDSHRPYHLRNVSSTKVWVFDDSPAEFDTSELPLDIGWEDEWGNVSDAGSAPEDSSSDADDLDSDSDPTASDSDGDSNSDGEADQDDGDDDQDDDDDDDEDDVHFDANADADGAAAKKRSRKRRRTRRARRRTRRRLVSDDERKERRILRDYYAAAPAGMSSACLAHNLSTLLRRAGADSLWGAVVGLTHQYLSAVVEASFYEDAVEYCRKQIADVMPRDVGAAEAGGSARGEEGPVVSAGYGSGGGGHGADSIGGRILPSSEFRLDLVRHWSLYDCLRYSSYTTTRLTAWRKTGLRRLEELLATLGIPLKESRQQWCYMSAACKSALDDRLMGAVRRFSLGKDIQYESFVRVLPGHRGKISAADVVLGLQAMLELDSSDPKRSFFRALDALNGSSLDSALHLAVNAQRLVAEIGGEVVERRRYISSGPFRYVFLRDVASPESLAHPLLLRRLGLFLLEAMLRGGARSKPFVVLAPDVARGIWHAVAVVPSGERNNFGARFRRAAEKNGTSVSFDGFDSPACQIQDGQETDFVRYLHDIML